MRKTCLYLAWTAILALFGSASANATKSLQISTNTSETKQLSTHPTGGSPVYPCLYCGDGYNVKGLSFQVTITNNGDEDFAVGDEGYSVTLYLNNPTIDLITVPIPEPLSAGQKKSFVFNWGGDEGFSFEPAAEYFSNGILMPNQFLSFCGLGVRENIKNTSQYRVGNPFYIYANEAHFEILPATGIGAPFGNNGFGILSEKADTTINYRLHSFASKDVVISEISLPEGFSTTLSVPATVKGGLSAASADEMFLNFPITFQPSAPGVYTGEVSVKMQGDAPPRTFKISGGKQGGNAWFEGFEGCNAEKLPAGWILGNNISCVTKVTNLLSPGDSIMLDHSYSGPTNITRAISPKIKFNASDKLLFDARPRTSSGNGSPVVRVFYSPDRLTWESCGIEIMCNNTAQANLNATDLFNITSPFPLKQYVVNVPEGEYYLAFEMGNSSIDNIFGGELADVPCDFYVQEYSMPSSMMVNKGGLFSMNIKNMLPAKGLSQNDYEVALFINGKKTVTPETIDWGPNTALTFDMAYVPHQAGKINAYMSIKSGDYEIKTPETTINVVEETLVAEATVGTAVPMNTTNDTLPFYFYYRNSTTDIIFPADYLAKYGITPGTVINGMSVMGYAASTKDIPNNEITVKFAPVAQSSLTAADERFDLSAVEPIYTKTGISLTSGNTSNIYKLINFTFSTPYIYEGGNLLMQCSSENATADCRTYCEFTNELTQNARVRFNDNYNTYQNNPYTLKSFMPVITFSLAVSPAELSGTVTHNNQPVANAKVTLSGTDEVIYNATTNEEGKYNITVFQADKDYDMTVSAEGLVLFSASEPLSFADGSLVKDIEVNDYAVITGNVSNSRDGAVADALVVYSCGDYTSSAKTDSEGNYELKAYQFAPEVTVSVDPVNNVFASKTIDMSVPQNTNVDFEVANFSNNRDYTLSINVKTAVDASLENLPFTLKSLRFDETYPAKETKLDADGNCVIPVYGGTQQLVIKSVGTEEKTINFNVNRDYELNVLLGEDVQNPQNVQSVLIHDVMTGRNDLLISWNPDDAAAKAVRRVIKRSSRNPYESFVITMDGTKVGETEDYEYVIEAVPGGTHLITVTAKYATTQSDAVSIISEITNDNYVPVVFNVTNNANANLNGVAVNLRGEDNYAVSLENDRAIIGYLPKGTYTVALDLYGFEPYSQAFDFDAPAFVDINLTEIITKPYNLRATFTENADASGFEVKADWNQVFGMTDSFEAYDDFATEFGDWKTIDNNTEASYPMMWGNKLVTFPGSSTPTLPVSVAPMIFNPEGTTPSMAGEASVTAADGKKSVIFQGPQAAKADKWIISPAVDIQNGFATSIAAKAYSAYPEAFEICISTEGDAPESFTVLNKIVPENTDWTVYTQDLSAYTGQTVRVAIHCVSEDGFMLQVDDFKIFDPDSEEAMDMGNVLNYELTLGDRVETTTATTHTFTNVPEGSYTLGLKALYASGASEQATYPLNMVSGIDGIAADSTVSDVINAQGIVVLRNATINQVRKLEKGIYIYNKQKIIVK
ncbi:MAG: carboxypeptidase-like regulatory domain-containing protein [Prevotella sp.]|nr:carboxypeptidase-like regulatory domain-containing protein [Prevotella sp.]MCM1075262.1 carboxypeptidase-like regulatory domain-containing protein [Ruminococcus sp.]